MVSPVGLGCLARALRSDESGAVTIDWVALTAGLLLLGIMVVHSIFNGGVSTLVSKVNSTLVAFEPNISADGDPADDSDPTDSGGTTGKASEQACIRTGKFVVCMGPK